MITWGYVAGFFDGEGCVYIHHAKRFIIFTNASLRALREIQAFLKAGRIYRKHPDSQRRKTCYWLHILAVEDLRRIVPKLIARCYVKDRQLVRLQKAIKGRMANGRRKHEGVAFTIRAA